MDGRDLSTAQTLMRDSPLLMEKLKLSHGHKLDTIATQNMLFLNKNKLLMHQTQMDGEDSSTAQTLTRE